MNVSQQLWIEFLVSNESSDEDVVGIYSLLSCCWSGVWMLRLLYVYLLCWHVAKLGLIMMGCWLACCRSLYVLWTSVVCWFWASYVGLWLSVVLDKLWCLCCYAVTYAVMMVFVLYFSIVVNCWGVSLMTYAVMDLWCLVPSAPA